MMMHVQVSRFPEVTHRVKFIMHAVGMYAAVLQSYVPIRFVEASAQTPGHIYIYLNIHKYTYAGV